MSTLHKIDYVLELPFDYLRKFTMPPPEKEHYDRILCIIWPFPGSLFILYGFGLLENTLALYIAMTLAFFVTIVFYVTQRNLKQGEAPSYYIVISLITTLTGLLWTYILSEMMIDLLNVFVIEW
jgi:hypothetical protein